MHQKHMGHVTKFPTKTTVYDPQKSWNGYTLFMAPDVGAMLIDMEGNEVHTWKKLIGFPCKMLPGGYVMGSTWERNKNCGFQDMGDLVEMDWNGNILWKFDNLEKATGSDDKKGFMARQHHDYERQGNPCGYFSPEHEALAHSGTTLILCHEDAIVPEISKYPLLDDKIIEVSWEGNILWQWNAREHFHEFGFTEAMKRSIYDHPNILPTLQKGDWLHINSASWLGENPWYDQGDLRFHPENIIIDSKEAGFIAIISKETGHIVWRIGPDFSKNIVFDPLMHGQPEESIRAIQNIGPIIGQHHAHMIPRGLPGNGNILVFDNGGWGGYGVPSLTAPDGHNVLKRDYSRVLEINPITFLVEWQYSAAEAGFLPPFENFRFYSPLVSSVQRLPNGNTLICEGVDGRIFEVTPKHELVWEYINPYIKHTANSTFMLPGTNMVYRAYRIPYKWVPDKFRVCCSK